MRRIISLLLISASSALAGGSAAGQCVKDAPFPGDPAGGDQFGFSVSISNDLCVVGARLDDNAGGLNAGAAYVFRLNAATGQWVQEAKLTALDSNAADEFGYSVAACAGGSVPGGVGDDVVIVGSRFDDDAGSESGSAYIFRRLNGGWVQMAKLVASDAAPTDHFGFSVAISGGLALVSSRDDDAPGTNQGSAYVYAYNGANWPQQAKLKASDGAANDQFGQGAALVASQDGTAALAVIGAWHDDSPLADAGSAYVFRYAAASDKWTQEAKLVPTNVAAGDLFGYSVSVAMDTVSGGDLALIGARDDDGNGPNSGSAYFFRKTAAAWDQGMKLVASDRVQNDGFGSSVSLDALGEAAIVGAWHHDAGPVDSGAAYVFLHDAAGSTWSQMPPLVAGDGAANDIFGNAVSISGDRALMGAPQHDGVASDSGSVYCFAGVSGTDLNNDGIPDGCQVAGDVNGDGTVNALDIVAVIGAWGLCPVPPAACPADLNGDGIVGIDDILAVLAKWS